MVVAAGFILLQANESLFFLDSEQQALEASVSEEEKRAASRDLQEFERRLARDPADAPALVGAGEAELRLGKVKEAAARLKGPVEAQRADPARGGAADTQLALDYASALSGMGRHADAAEALRAQAQALPSEKLPVVLLKRLSDEYSNAGQAAQAVDFFLRAQKEWDFPAATPTPDDRAEGAATGDAGAGGGADTATNLGGGLGAAVSEPELRLLLGRAYSAWPGHQQDALATYNAFLRDLPDDYRGYAAKGALLAQGEDFAGADRAFLQGRYHARTPLERATVDQARAQATLKQLEGTQRTLRDPAAPSTPP